MTTSSSNSPPEDALRDDGFCVVPNALSADDITRLGVHLDEYAASRLLVANRPQGLVALMHASARENVAFSGQMPDSLERVGHRLFELNVVTAAFRAAGVMPLLNALLDDVVVVSAALIVKQAGSEQVYGLHRDTWFLHPDPEQLMTVTIALDVANQHSGGLEVVPGSHKHATTYRVKLRGDGWQATRPGPSPARPKTAVAVDLQPGDALLIDGRLWHGSPVNESANRRRLLVAQFSSAHATWPADSWIPGPYPRFAELP